VVTDGVATVDRPTVVLNEAPDHVMVEPLIVGVAVKVTDPPEKQIKPLEGLVAKVSTGKVEVTAVLGDSQTPIISET